MQTMWTYCTVAQGGTDSPRVLLLQSLKHFLSLAQNKDKTSESPLNDLVGSMRFLNSLSRHDNSPFLKHDEER